MSEPRINVMCAGSAREMGMAQGAGLREQIHGARRVVERLEAFRLQRPWWLPESLYRWVAGHAARRMLARPLARHAPDMAQRLAGMAEGAGIAGHALYLINAAEALMSSVERSITVPPPGACSAVAVTRLRSATGEPVIARNFDYLPALQPFYIVRDSRPGGRLRSLDFTAAPTAGAVDGLNEAGLAITYNYAYVADSGGSAPTVSMAIADALATCSTVAEAAERIASRPRWGGAVYMLADAEGDIASLELANTRSHLRRPEPGTDLLCHTNQFTAEAMRKVQVHHDAVFTDHAPVALQGLRVHESAECRDARLAEILPQTERYGPNELAALMADHGPAGEPDGNTTCMHSAYWHTTACVQLLPRSRRMRIAYDTACGATYQELGL